MEDSRIDAAKRDTITGVKRKYNPLNKRDISEFELDEIFLTQEDEDET